MSVNRSPSVGAKLEREPSSPIRALAAWTSAGLAVPAGVGDFTDCESLWVAGTWSAVLVGLAQPDRDTAATRIPVMPLFRQCEVAMMSQPLRGFSEKKE